MTTANEIIQKLDLKPLPDEGGFYRQTYRSGDQVLLVSGIENQKKQVATAIYYLVTPESFSALHRLKSDEIFHFYLGDPIEMIQIDPSGGLTRIAFGSDVLNDQVPQILVPKGTWQALKLHEGGRWALMGTTVAPGFEFEDFELGNRKTMVLEFPEHKKDIWRFTKP